MMRVNSTILYCAAGFAAVAGVTVLGNRWEGPLGEAVVGGVHWVAAQVSPQKPIAKSKLTEYAVVFSDQDADAIDQEFQRLKKYVTDNSDEITKAMAFLKSKDEGFRLKTYIANDDLVYGVYGLKTAVSISEKKAVIKHMQRGSENFNWQLTRAIDTARANNISLAVGPTKTHICVMRKLEAHVAGQAGPNPDFRVSMESLEAAPLPPG